MAKYTCLADGSWTSPSESTGSIQCQTGIIEISAVNEDNTGIRLTQGDMVAFDGAVYVRSVANRDSTFTTVPFDVTGGGGGGGGGGTPYTLPTASETIKGGIKIGSGLKMDEEVLSVDGTGVESWATGTEYEVGDIVLFNNILYKAIRAHTSTTFASDTANWELVYSSIPLWTANTQYKVGNIVINGHQIYRCSTAHTSNSTFNDQIGNWQLVAEVSKLKEWTRNTDYLTGELIYYDGVIFVVASDHNSGSVFLPSRYYLLNASIEDWEPDRYYPQDVVVTIDNTLYRCLHAHRSSDTPDMSNFIIIGGSFRVWEQFTPYNIGDVVLYNGVLYRCKQVHGSRIEFDIEKWDFVKVLLSSNANNTLEYKDDGLYQEDPEGLTAAEIKAIVPHIKQMKL